MSEYLTTRQVAERYDVAYTTVMGWLTRGLLPFEERQETRGKVLLIPKAALDDFRKPTTGRPPKASAQTSTGKAAQ